MAPPKTPNDAKGMRSISSFFAPRTNTPKTSAAPEPAKTPIVPPLAPPSPSQGASCGTYSGSQHELVFSQSDLNVHGVWALALSWPSSWTPWVALM